MRIREWCAEVQELRMRQGTVVTKERLAATLIPVLSEIMKLAGRLHRCGLLDDFSKTESEYDLADTAIAMFHLCQNEEIDLQEGIDRVLRDPTPLCREPDFDVTEQDVIEILEILMDAVCFPVFTLWGELLKRENPELVMRLSGSIVLSLFRLGEQLGFDLSAVIDKTLADEREDEAMF